jgi:hypothetical protein
LGRIVEDGGFDAFDPDEPDELGIETPGRAGDGEENDEDEELDLDTDDEAATIPCPHCRRPVYEEAQKCEHCGSYLSDAEPTRFRPWWMIAGFILVLIWFAVYVLHW